MVEMVSAVTFQYLFLDVLLWALVFSWNYVSVMVSFSYPVSSFSYRLLDQMFGDPLFAIGDVSPGLYRKARQLERTRQLRMQLYYLKDFVLTCRFADK